jgi:hypothetical protein
MAAVLCDYTQPQSNRRLGTQPVESTSGHIINANGYCSGDTKRGIAAQGLSNMLSECDSNQEPAGLGNSNSVRITSPKVSPKCQNRGWAHYALDRPQAMNQVSRSSTSPDSAPNNLTL